MSDRARIVEVGPRDGLQNEKAELPLKTKVALVNGLAHAGIKHIEAGSFVSAKWVPQMANSDALFKQIDRIHGVTYAGLTPNIRGFEEAINCNVDEVAVFTAASEAFTQKNINCSIEESIERFKPIIERASASKIKVRAYLSCIAACPYGGATEIRAVVSLAKKLVELGCYEVSLGDTIGVASPGQIKTLLRALLSEMPADQLACHFHDTYGQALANQFVALELGLRTFDTSVAGLGGCPYAKGASGNVSTEDTVYMLENSGISTGVNLEKLVSVSDTICRELGRRNHSNVANALLGASNF